jgi:uncharacterized protein
LKKRLTKFFFILISAYLLLILAVYSFQEKIIFQSDTLEEDYTFSFDQTFYEFKIIGANKKPINALIFNPEIMPSKGTVLYFHGNADNMQRWGNYAIDFTSLGYQVLMIDYTGFGKSRGVSNEDVLYQNAEDTWVWAQHHLPAKKFTIYGRSLGTGIASHLATNHQADQLILETPFYELAQEHIKVLFPFGLKYEFPTYKNLPKIDYPISIIQGTDDLVVHFSSAEKLKPLLKLGDHFYVIEGGGHKNLREFEEYHKILEEIL